MSAQLEDGYTRIANELLDNLPKYKFNGTQLRIIMVIWRFTYGFKRKDHEMSLTFFIKATGLGKTQIDRELTNLIDFKVLVVTEESTYTKSRKLGFNKNYDSWLIEYSQQKDGQSAKTLTVSENAEEQSADTRTPTVSENADQERKSFKNNFKEISTTTENPFRLFESEGFGTLSYTIGEKLGKMIDEYSERWTCEAMKVAVYRGKRSLGYVDGILKSFQSSGVDEPWNQPNITPFPKGGRNDVPRYGSGHDGRTDAQLNALSL